MLLRLKVQNFRSICEAQELSLVASNLVETQTGALRTFQNVGTTALPMAAIYGANASGKTTVMRALSFLRNAVENSQTRWAPGQAIENQPFAFEELSYATKVEVDFVLDDSLFSFGFSADSEKFLEEWLTIYPHGKRQVLYRRQAGRKFTYGRNFIGNKKVVESTVRENSLFISAAAQNNNDLAARIYKWIASWLFITDGRDIDDVADAKLFRNKETCDLLVKFLEAADLGIVGLKTKEASESTKVLMQKVMAALPPELQREAAERVGSEMIKLQMIHRGRDGTQVALDTDDESNGTIAYLYLLPPIILALSEGRLLCIDELDESLHPALVRKLLELFRSPIRNPKGAQLVFNTHDTNLLSLDLLRRDEIWFTEKDSNGATHLYPLSDFKPRLSESVAKGYLQGRYGAIPFLGDFEELMKGDDVISEVTTA